MLKPNIFFFFVFGLERLQKDQKVNYLAANERRIEHIRGSIVLSPFAVC